MPKLLTDVHYSAWLSSLTINIKAEFEKIESREWSADNFRFATAVSVMSSSKIEGEELEIDSYLKHKMLDVDYLPNLTEKPNDLYAAYEFARDNKLTKENFLTAHAVATLHLLPQTQRGVVRKGNMLIMEQQTQQVKYEAAAASVVNIEFEKFWKELDALIEEDMPLEKVFYYAAFIHLVFVKIHPFNDGNGRTARLLEKWFLATKLREKAWYIPSELYYYDHLKAYYHNLAHIGLFYYALLYHKAIPFLQMLPQALIINK